MVSSRDTIPSIAAACTTAATGAPRTALAIELIMAVLTEIRRREAGMLAEHVRTSAASGPELIQAVWDWASSAERAPFMRLFFEVYIDAIAHPGTYSERGQAMVTDWLDQFGTVLDGSPADAADTASATLAIAVLRGLLLDRLSTGDEQRTDRALVRFTQLLGGHGQRPDSEKHSAPVQRPPDPRQAGCDETLVGHC